MLNKKAQQEIIPQIYQLMIIGIVLVILLVWVGGIGSDTFYEKMYLTRDIALITNTIYSANGNVHYSYSIPKTEKVKGIDLTQFTFILRNQEIKIPEGKELGYSYGDDKSIFETLNKEITKPKKIDIENSGNKVDINEIIKSDFRKLKYPPVETKDENWQKKVPIFFSDEKLNPITKKADYFNVLLIPNTYTKRHGVSAAYALLSSKHKPTEITKVVTERGNKLAVMFFESANKNVFIIRISANEKNIKQSRKLATIILNNLLTETKRQNVKEFDNVKPIIIPIKTEVKEIPIVSFEIGENILKLPIMHESVAQLNTFNHILVESIEEYYTK